VGPSLLAGVGLALSLPPWGFWVLAFPAAGLLWWRLGGLRLRARLLAGWVAGLGLFVPGLWWATTFNTYGGAVLMGVEALAPALACALVPARGRGRTAVLVGGMVLAEALLRTGHRAEGRRALQAFIEEAPASMAAERKLAESFLANQAF